jgi:catechol 2,3-dioxygenase-like lactoylglutathione lyase family enzyme
MRFRLMSVFVDDQEKALAFYTDVLPFVPSVRTSTLRRS